MQPEIRLATPQDRDVVVDTIVTAFADDPAFGYFFGSGPGYEAGAPVFAGYLFDARVSANTVWMTDDGGAVALWDQPESTSRSDDDIARKAELFRQAERDMGDAAARIHAYDEPVEALLPSTDYWYLGILASHPDRRGEGLARRVAEHGLARAQADGVPAFLETTNPGNVALYERSGWVVTDAITVVDDVPVWVLRHG